MAVRSKHDRHPLILARVEHVPGKAVEMCFKMIIMALHDFLLLTSISANSLGLDSGLGLGKYSDIILSGVILSGILLSRSLQLFCPTEKVFRAKSRLSY